jgi:hypothetical protein
VNALLRVRGGGAHADDAAFLKVTGIGSVFDKHICAKVSDFHGSLLQQLQAEAASSSSKQQQQAAAASNSSKQQQQAAAASNSSKQQQQAAASSSSKQQAAAAASSSSSKQ